MQNQDEHNTNIVNAVYKTSNLQLFSGDDSVYL